MSVPQRPADGGPEERSPSKRPQDPQAESTSASHSAPPTSQASSHPPQIQGASGSSTTPPVQSSERPNYLSGRAYALSQCGGYVYRALNTTWVPEPCTGSIEVILRSDGRYGAADPLHWPQVYCDRQPHWALIPRPPNSYEHPAAILWEVPTQDYFCTEPTATAEPFGSIKEPVRLSLERAVQVLDIPRTSFRASLMKRIEDVSSHAHSTDPHVAAHLRSQAQRRDYYQDLLDQLTALEARLNYALSMFLAPSSFRDCILQWAHLHRCWAEAWAWLQWQTVKKQSDPAHPNPMHRGLDGGGVRGCFCYDKETALRMYTLGIPVWHIVAVQVSGNPNVRDARKAAMPTHITQSIDGMPSRKCVVAPGLPQLQAIANFSHRLVDYAKFVYKPGQTLAPEQEMIVSSTSTARKSVTHSG